MNHKSNTACMKKQRQSGYSVLTRRYLPNGEYHLEPEWIKDTMSDKCRSDMDVYKLGPCGPCKYPQDREYLVAQGLLIPEAIV